MIKVLDLIGEFGPIILFVITLFLLRFKATLFVYYCVGMLFKTIINSWLKVTIQQPRPIEDPKLFDSVLQYHKSHHFYYQMSYDKYGMPSGHASSVFYSTMFVQLAFHDVKLTFFYFLVSLITLFQRVSNLYHTVLQVIFGALLGMLIGWVTFYMATQHKMGSLQLKKDDFAPMFNGFL
jgi:membrane-associated phospholipid phosphatase